MKIAVSSATFGRPIDDGTLTQLEWLDMCANELEVDGVVFDAAHFPRTDDEYLAQLKKVSADLGLTVAGFAAGDLFSPAAQRRFSTALALGAPLILAAGTPASDDPAAWGAFADIARSVAGTAKRCNVTLAIRNQENTLCTSAADLRRLAKDIDSAWLRYALDPLVLSATADTASLLPRTAIARTNLDAIADFATPADSRAPTLIRVLSRFRGFTVIDTIDVPTPSAAYHEAIERFRTLRTTALAT